MTPCPWVARMAVAHEVRLVVYVCCGSVSVVRVALYCQINWISLAVVGGCTALFMVGALRTIPREDFLRVVASLGAAHEMSRYGRRHWTGLARHVARRRSPLSRLAVQSDQGAGDFGRRRVGKAVDRRRRERLGGRRHDQGFGRPACGAPHAPR